MTLYQAFLNEICHATLDVFHVAIVGKDVTQLCHVNLFPLRPEGEETNIIIFLAIFVRSSAQRIFRHSYFPEEQVGSIVTG